MRDAEKGSLTERGQIELPGEEQTAEQGDHGKRQAGGHANEADAGGAQTKVAAE